MLRLSFKVNASETAEFTLSTIPAGASVLVMEKTKGRTVNLTHMIFKR